MSPASRGRAFLFGGGTGHAAVAMVRARRRGSLRATADRQRLRRWTRRGAAGITAHEAKFGATRYGAGGGKRRGEQGNVARGKSAGDKARSLGLRAAIYIADTAARRDESAAHAASSRQARRTGAR